MNIIYIYISLSLYRTESPARSPTPPLPPAPHPRPGAVPGSASPGELERQRGRVGGGGGGGGGAPTVQPAVRLSSGCSPDFTPTPENPQARWRKRNRKSESRRGFPVQSASALAFLSLDLSLIL